MHRNAVIRKTDDLNRIVIPVEYGIIAGISPHSSVSITQVNRRIILEAAQPICKLCGGEREVKDVHGNFLCQSCILEIKQAK